LIFDAPLQQASLSQNAQWRSQKPFNRNSFDSYFWDTTLAAISKMQITFKDKARADEKAQSRQRRDEQYILRRSATP
jgi:hypothetical protein